MITAFTSWSSASHCGHTFVGGIVYLQSYSQRPIIELAKNVSPSLAYPDSMRPGRDELRLSQVRTKWPLSAWSRFIIRMRVFRGVKNGRLARSCTNRKRSSFATKHFQRKSLKIFDLHPPLGRLLSFVARIITFKVRC